MSLRICPRCGDRTFEKLETYAHCFECLYSEDYWQSAEDDFYNAMRVMDEYERILAQLEIDEHLSDAQSEGEGESEPTAVGA